MVKSVVINEISINNVDVTDVNSSVRCLLPKTMTVHYTLYSGLHNELKGEAVIDFQMNINFNQISLDILNEFM